MTFRGRVPRDWRFGLGLALAAAASACETSAALSPADASVPGDGSAAAADGRAGCVPGQQVACPCVGGGQGAQICADDGTRFGACQCGGLIDVGAGDGGVADAAVADAAAIAPRGPLVLLERLHAPTGLAVDGARFYWADEMDGTISSCPLAGCDFGARAMLASQQRAPRGLAVDATNVYWVGAGAPGAFVVRKCPIGGCGTAPPTDLVSAPGDGYGLAVDGQSLYVAVATALVRCPLAGCTAGAPPETLVMGQGIGGVAVNATHFYYLRASTSRPDLRAVYRCPRAGCGPGAVDELLIGGTGSGTLSLGLDANNIYWTENYGYLGTMAPAYSGNAISYCPLAGCAPYAPSTVTHGDVWPWAVALDARFFYWTDNMKGRITRTQKTR